MDPNIIQVGAKLTLKTAVKDDFAAVSEWFIPIGADTTPQVRALVRQWAGPNITYPCTAEKLGMHIMGGHYQSFVLRDHQSIVGFGQLQLVKHRAHLARLAINPEYRGQKQAKRLLSALIENAQGQITLKEVSLFVYVENTVAITCYQRFGFAESATPIGVNALDGCRFMTLRY